ncbi:molybdopterin converting factor subunit 1 [Salaquimonas pukyongi]|uniref:molybdopterin converting factor subunit 1 n=1 Tax=Salaquimonas pukyongi TaxID=2712698 RepID=UPI00096BB38C|nr:molybdopterin converting factor subunit 1 [Salaquimonas pukyongi]
MKLVYFSWIRERLDLAEEEADLPDSVKTLGDLLAWQKGRGEEFAAVFAHEKIVRVALNQEHVDDPAAPLEDVREAAFFPPMTGG